MVNFGKQAVEDGYEHPDAMVSVAELAKSLGAPTLALLDVRPSERFALGHIPGARRLYRSDYSSAEAYPGMSRSGPELEELLRHLGVRSNSTVVVYGDGGPEPYRLWWTLRSMAGFDARVLDGGLQAWKAAGHRVAGGDGVDVAAGDVTVGDPSAPSAEHWADVTRFAEAHPGTKLLDTRSDIEFTGEEKHPKAARAGRIPGAAHLDWADVLRDKDGDHRLRTPSALRELFADHDVVAGTPVVTYCQSGTRSAAVYYALYEIGFSPDQALNYDGSWAEYSRLDLSVEP